MRSSLSVVVLASLVACHSSTRDQDRSIGQTSFESAPPNGGIGGGDAEAGAGSAPPTGLNPPTASSSTRAVEETDLYRLDGNRLYFLNSYRGLMVFDVTTPDQPRMLGRSPIFGNPVDMI